MLTLLHGENCLSYNLYFIFGVWHNYWEFSKLCPRDPKSFQEHYCIYICLCVGWCFSSEGVLFGCIQKPYSLWKLFYEALTPGSSQAAGQREMVSWRVSRVTASGHASWSLSLPSLWVTGSSQLSSASLQPGSMLGQYILSSAHKLWSCLQQGLAYIPLQPGALHWSPVFCISVELGKVGNSCRPRDSSDFQAQKRVRHKGNQLNWCITP